MGNFWGYVLPNLPLDEKMWWGRAILVRPLLGLKPVPLDDGLPGLRYHVLPVLRLRRAGPVFAWNNVKSEIKRDYGTREKSAVGISGKRSPASRIRPISSFLPMLSKSMTITSSEHSLIFSHGTLNENVSLKTGFSVHLKMAVLRFSMRLSPNCSHTLTYGSKKIRQK